MKCKSCGRDHDGLFGSGLFCSRSCANKRERNDEYRLMISKIQKNSKAVLLANQKRAKTKVIKRCPVCGKKMKLCPSESGQIYCSIDCYRADIKREFRKGGGGGYRVGSGRGKNGFYKGIQCDSSYELAWVIYHIDSGINFVRNKKWFEYEYMGSLHKYFPDFYLPDNDMYVEIKGFVTEQHIAKMKYAPNNIRVLYKKDMVDIISYAIEKYGRDFIKVYQGNPHKQKNNKCLECGEPAAKMYCSNICSGRAANKKKYKK